MRDFFWKNLVSNLVGGEGFEPSKAGANRFHVILQFPVSVDYIFTFFALLRMKVFRYLVSTAPSTMEVPTVLAYHIMT
jgi:hypothetical protein